MNKFSEYLNIIKPGIDRKLDKIFEEDKKTMESYGIFGQDSIRKIIDFSKRGKSLRGGLFVLSCEIFGKTRKDYIFEIASAVEIIQSALLIHDDIIDDDYFRRGKPSVFAQFIPTARKEKIKDEKDFAKSMGICIGDIGFFYGLDVFGRSSIKAHLSREAMVRLVREILIVGIAQENDVFYGKKKSNPELSEIIKVYTYKTARYTFSLPLVLGAVICGQNKNIQKILEEFGEYAGILYQIRDDEIGLFSAESAIGKTVGSDIREDKKTVIRLFLYQNASYEERKRMDGIFGKNEIEKSDIEYLKAVAERINLDRKLAALKKVYFDKAVYLFKKLKSLDSQDLFKDVLEFAVSRKK